MKIIACIKRVPTTDLEPKIADQKRLDPSGVVYETSFYDQIAVEAALQVKEQHGGEVTVITIGPKDSQKELRDALAKGADQAVLLDDEDWMNRDAHATAKALEQKITELGADLVFTGRVATDRDNAAVGVMLATLMDFACVSDVVELSVDGSGGTAKREADGGIETYSFSLPAVITCQKDLNEPRLAGLKGIMAAKKKPLDESPAQPAENQAQVTSLEMPPPRPEGRIVGEGAAAVDALMDALRNEAKVL